MVKFPRNNIFIMIIFVSHSSSDNSILHIIKQKIEDHGITCWNSEAYIMPDEKNVSATLKNAVDNCDVFLLLWSKRAKESQYVRDEIHWISEKQNKHKSTYVICVDTELPRELFQDPFYLELNKKSIDEIFQIIMDDIKKKNKLTFEDQIERFKKEVIEHYETFPDMPIIQNFRKFDGFHQYVEQPFINMENGERGDDVLQYAQDRILKYIGNIKEEQNEIKKLKDDNEKSKTKLSSKKLEEKISKIKKEKIIVIVGDYGSGKSALCNRLMYKLCGNTEYFVSPIFIPLGNLTDDKNTASNLVNDIHSFITKNYGIKVTQDKFVKAIQDGQITFVLDALDEMSFKIDGESAQRNLQHVLELSKNCPVLLTSRHTYITGNMHKDVVKYKEFVKLYDFEQDEIDKFVDLLFKDDEDKADEIKKVMNNEKVKELARKPLFLDIMCKNFDLLKEHITKIINEVVVMRIVTDQWIKHDVSKKYENDVDEIINERQEISEILAMVQYKNHGPIRIDAIKLELSNEFGRANAKQRDGLDRYLKDARDSTFLVKEDDDRFKFILNPIMEYFVACRIIRTISSGGKQRIIKEINQIYSEAVFDFIKNIIDLEWTVKPHFLTKFTIDDPIRAKLINSESKHKKLIDILKKAQKERSTDCFANLVKILHITNLLPDKPDLSNLNLDHLSIPEASLNNSTLANAKLVNSNLQRVSLRDSNLVGVNLDNSNLEHANLINCDMTKSSLNDASMSEVILNKTSLAGAKLKNINLHGAKMNECNIKDADATNANLSNADLRKMIARKTIMVKVDLSNSILNASIMNGANLKGADLSNANLNDVDLSDADLRDAKLNNILTRKIILRNSKLQFAHLNGAVLNNADLSYSNLNDADLSDVDLRGANLTGVKLRRAKLINANLIGVILNDADLSNAILDGSNLSHSTIEKTEFVHASMIGTNLNSSKLKNVNFNKSNLSDINMKKSHLENISFKKTILDKADLRNVNLINTNLHEASSMIDAIIDN